MTKIKVGFTTVFTAIFSTLGLLTIPIILLVGANIVDYITSLSAAASRGESIRGQLGFRGVMKKIHMYFLILMGGALDILLKYTMGAFNLDEIFTIKVMNLDFLIATVIALWLLFNEMISILENMSDAGTSIPPFLYPLLKKIQGELDDRINIDDESDDKDIAEDKEIDKDEDGEEQ